MNRTFCITLLFVWATFVFHGCDQGRPGLPDTKPSAEAEKAAADVSRVNTKAGEAQASIADMAPPKSAYKKTRVRVISIAPQPLNIQSTYVGHLLPGERVLMKSEMEGVIETVSFEEADEVEAGEKLINISTKELTLRLQMAQTDFKLAESNLMRDEQLAEQDLIPAAQLDLSRTRFDSARLSAELALINLKKSVISSPLRGTVKKRHVKVGEFVKKGGVLVEILDIDRILVKIHIPEQDIMYVHEGQRVVVELYALEEKQFQGSVKTIGLEADSRNRSFPVEIVLNNSKRELRPGMLTRVMFTQELSQNEIVIPRHTILERDEGRVVFMHQDGVAHERIIETGLSQQDRVQVLSGLSIDEELIVEGHTKLTDQEPVTVISF